MFLKNNFAGNARENLLKTLVTHKIMTDHEVKECLRYYFQFLSLSVAQYHERLIEVQSTEST